MADVAKRLYGTAQPTTTAATVYDPPAAGCVLKQVYIQNATGTSATMTISIGTDAAATRIMDAQSVPANGFLIIDVWIPLVDADIIQAKQGTTGACTLTLSGVEL